ncbi:efflux RND transporter periplasmic adaptor subunit [Cetobacterium sp.]|uniref:efflux RND transporter periplasmic adaptor subunit n=1 Tax=Cetobacterium sp. TaxID=2071632 RepID=UPI003F38DED1
MKKYIFVILIIFLTGCKNEENPVKKVKIALIERKSIENRSVYSGKVFPGDKTQLLSSSAGIADSVFVKEGDSVKSGDILFTYKSSAITENEIKLSTAKLELDMLENELINYDVQKKETGIRNRELEIKALEYEIKKGKDELPILKSSIANSEKVVQMYTEFLKEESVSVFELEEKKTELLTKIAAYESLKMKQELDEQKYKLLVLTKDSVQKDLQYKEEKLKSAYESLKKEVLIYERALLEAREGVKAQKSGILTKFSVYPEEKLERLQSIGMLSSGENYIVNIRVPVYQASKIKIGQKVRVKFSDFSGTEKYNGEISRVSNFATESSNRLGIDAEIELKDENLKSLKPGYMVEVEVSNSAQENYLLVKKFSVREENGDKYVFVLKDDKAVKKIVEIGAEGDSDYEVLNLSEGTKIILNPFAVKEGDKIEVVK